MPQLADLIRAKYPDEYKDLSDEELETSVLAKHPEYKDLVISKPQPTEISTTIKSDNVSEPPPAESGIQKNPLTAEGAAYDIAPQTPPEEPSLLSKLYHGITEPITTLPSDIGSKIAQDVTEPHLNDTRFDAIANGFFGGGIKGLGDLVSGMTSPVNLATAILSGGSSIARKSGLEAIASALNTAARVSGAPMAIHGAADMIAPDNSLGQRAQGIAELAGGVLGMRGHIGDIAKAGIEPGATVHEEIPLDNQPSIDLPNPVQELPPDFTPIGSENEFNATRQSELPLSPEEKVFRNASEKQGMGLPAPAEAAPLSPVNKLTSALDTAKPLEAEQADIYSKERGQRISEAIKVGTPGRAGHFERLGKLAGEHTKVDFEPLESKLSPADIDQLHETINNHPDLSPYDKISASDGLEKMLSGSVPQAGQIEKLSKVFGSDLTDKFERFYKENKQSKLQQAYDLPRGLMSVDPPFITSAAFRQGASLIGTKAWFASWVDAAKSYGSSDLAKELQSDINAKPLFRSNPAYLDESGKPTSAAQKLGLKQGDLGKYSKRDEPIRGELAEKIPVYGATVRGSNRAFTAFTNRLSADTFENLINDAEKQGLDPTGKNLLLGKQIAEFVNTAVRRGRIGVEAGSHELNLEKSARLLSNTLFSPRSISSQIRMLNPSTYVMAQPFVRKQYMAAMIRQVGTWWTLAEAAALLSKNVSVSHDPNSADFGKIKIGNVRIDPPGGLQQFLVLGHRMLPVEAVGGGTTSTNTGKFTEFGKGYKPNTRLSTLTDFAANRLHPTAKFAYDLLNVTEKQPFHVGDKIVQLALPMYMNDLAQVAKENPDLTPVILGLSGAGMGSQTYDKGSFGKSVFIPEKYDLNIGAK